MGFSQRLWVGCSHFVLILHRTIRHPLLVPFAAADVIARLASAGAVAKHDPCPSPPLSTCRPPSRRPRPPGRAGAGTARDACRAGRGRDPHPRRDHRRQPGRARADPLGARQPLRRIGRPGRGARPRVRQPAPPPFPRAPRRCRAGGRDRPRADDRHVPRDRAGPGGNLYRAGPRPRAADGCRSRRPAARPGRSRDRPARLDRRAPSGRPRPRVSGRRGGLAGPGAGLASREPCPRDAASRHGRIGRGRGRGGARARPARRPAGDGGGTPGRRVRRLSRRAGGASGPVAPACLRRAGHRPGHSRSRFLRGRRRQVAGAGRAGRAGDRPRRGRGPNARPSRARQPRRNPRRHRTPGRPQGRLRPGRDRRALFGVGHLAAVARREVADRARGP